MLTRSKSSNRLQRSCWHCRSLNVPQDGLISFILPIKGTPEELGFVRNQLHSFDKFLAFDGLREMLILCPSEDLPHVTTFVQTLQHSLPRLQHLPLRVVPEGLCAPELLPGSVYMAHFPRWPGEHIAEAQQGPMPPILPWQFSLLPLHPFITFHSITCAICSGLLGLFSSLLAFPSPQLCWRHNVITP